MAPQKSLKICEVCQISPATNSTESATAEFTLPLTFFDTFWLKFPPVERTFFYQLTESESAPNFFNSVILPQLKQSLSQTLFHFLILAGHLTWPPNSHRPIIHYNPNDHVSVTVAESLNADFDNLCCDDIYGSIESRLYVPELPISDTKASIIALQITLFPYKGFSIGIVYHHAILDGKSTTMFVKAWAYICKRTRELQASPSFLPDYLTPLFDRDVIKDIAGLEMVHLDQWLALASANSNTNPRSLKVFHNLGPLADSSVRAVFKLTREDIKRLRDGALFHLDKASKEEKPMYSLSSFVLTCSYTSVCLVKARRGDLNRKVYFIFSVDTRSRLDPPIPENYFGNCVFSYDVVIEARSLVEENGVAVLAEKISSKIKGLEKEGLFGGAKHRLPEMCAMEPGAQAIGVAGSTRFEVYGSDFGWGRPKKVEITSIVRTESIGLAESRDGSGGVEIGIALLKPEMEAFASLFSNGLKVLYS